MTPQSDSERAVEVTGIMLSRIYHADGPGELRVCAEVDGEWFVVIGPEIEDGPISHIVNPSGIRKGERLGL